MQVGFLHVGPPTDGIRRYSDILSWGLKRYGFAQVLDEVIPHARLETVSSSAQKLSQQDIVHVQLRCLGGQVVLAPEPLANFPRTLQFLELCGAPIVATVHDVSTASCDESACRQIAQLANQCCFLIVFSRMDRERLKRYVPAEKLLIIPHFVEPRRRVAPNLKIKQMLGLPPARVLTVLGQIYQRKGYHIFLEAFAQLPSDYFVILAGRPSLIGASQKYANSLVEYIRAKGLTDRFRITGFLPDELLNYYLAATDLAVCPFLQSAASGSISTWISQQKPIVASDLPSLREYDLIAPGAITFYPAEDRQALADQIVGHFETGTPELQGSAVGQLREALQLTEICRRHSEIYRRKLVAASIQSAISCRHDSPPQPPERFAIVSLPRSGTHMLQTMLKQHPGVDVHGEIFNDQSPRTKPHWHLTTDEVLRFASTSPRGAMTGLILHLDHGTGRWSDIWQRVVNDHSFRFIAVKRRNHLARHLSKSRANIHQQWRVYRGQSCPQLGPLRIDPIEFEQDVRSYEERWQLWEELVPEDRRVTVWYEDIVQQPEVEWPRLLKHLELPPTRCPEPDTVKVGGDLSEQVANYGQLAEHFAGTRFAIYF